MEESKTSGLENITFKEGDNDLLIEIGNNQIMLWKYEGNPELRINISGHSEFKLLEQDIEALVKALTWYMQNKEKVPELIPVVSSRTGKTLYGIRKSELEERLRSGKYFME